MKLQQKLMIYTLLFLMGNTYVQSQTKANSNTFGKSNYELSDLLDEDRFLWSKIVWEYIDLSNPENKSLLGVVDPAKGKTQLEPLFDFLKNQIYTNPNADVFFTADFKEKMKVEEVKSKLTNIRKKGEYTDVFEVKADDVYGYLVKGIWYFDKIESTTRFIIVGIAPMGPDIQTLGVQNIDDDNIYELFWMYYPALQEQFSKISVYDSKNSLKTLPLEYYLSNREYIATEIDENSINNNNSVFISRDLNTFQLKKNVTKTDSIYKKKENVFWFKKKKDDATPEDYDPNKPVSTAKLTLREILAINQAYKKNKENTKKEESKKKKN
ncbi:gliding motility protein GldN [Polaribacter pacificus]|nr:gliding motility protein GldN [Polaribacter pacificus]